MRIAFNRSALVSLHLNTVSFHVGVYPDPTTVYKVKDGREVDVDCTWIWGRATEPYDHCLEYFGGGPLFLVCFVREWWPARAWWKLCKSLGK